MGASGSVFWDGLHDFLTEEEVKVILREEFNQAQFDSLKDPETGTLKRSILMELVHNRKMLAKEHEVREIYMLFAHVCPSGEMTVFDFVLYMKEAKLLNKKNFPKVEAELIFEKARKSKRDISKSLNFKEFMNICVPLIAEKMKVDTDVILKKLSKVEHGSFIEKESVGVDTSNLTPEEQAAKKIQTTARRKTVNLKKKKLEYTEKSAKNINDFFFDIPTFENLSEEIKLKDVFAKVCGSNLDMDLSSYMELCREGELFDAQFFYKSRHSINFFKS